MLAALTTLASWFFCKPKLARTLLLLTAAAGLVYFGLLLGFSLASHPEVLTAGQEKYFCEIDCHLAYSVVEWHAESRLGSKHYVVLVRTRFDENTISPRRPKDAPLTPNPREAELVDSAGNSYPMTSRAKTSLSTSLAPGEFYLSELDFDVPAGAGDLRLLIRSVPAWQDRLVIGDENSWLHQKTYFQL